MSAFLGTEATILFSSCFDANGGVFEMLFSTRGRDRSPTSSTTRRSSTASGCARRQRFRYRNRDMADLERAAGRGEGGRRAVHGDRHRRRVLDGRLSRAAARDLRPRGRVRRAGDGGRLARRRLRRASTARGTPEFCGVAGPRRHRTPARFGKALGGASGGYVSSRTEIVDLLRQRARPYLFSNALAPSVVAGSLAALDLLEQSDELRARLAANAALFRELMTEAGFDLLPGEHPIVPVMFGDAALAARIADEMLEARCLRDRVLVPGGAARQGAHPRAAVGGAHRRRDPSLRRRVHCSAGGRRGLDIRHECPLSPPQR